MLAWQEISSLMVVCILLKPVPFYKRKNSLQKRTDLLMFPFSTGCGSAWLERSVRDAEAARSNRAIPTKKSKTPQAQNLRRLLHQASKRFGALHGWLYTKDGGKPARVYTKDRGKRFLQAVILFFETDP